MLSSVKSPCYSYSENYDCRTPKKFIDCSLSKDESRRALREINETCGPLSNSTQMKSFNCTRNPSPCTTVPRTCLHILTSSNSHQSPCSNDSGISMSRSLRQEASMNCSGLKICDSSYRNSVNCSSRSRSGDASHRSLNYDGSILSCSKNLSGIKVYEVADASNRSSKRDSSIMNGSKSSRSGDASYRSVQRDGSMINSPGLKMYELEDGSNRSMKRDISMINSSKSASINCSSRSDRSMQREISMINSSKNGSINCSSRSMSGTGDRSVQRESSMINSSKHGSINCSSRSMSGAGDRSVQRECSMINSSKNGTINCSSMSKALIPIGDASYRSVKRDGSILNGSTSSKSLVPVIVEPPNDRMETTRFKGFGSSGKCTITESRGAMKMRCHSDQSGYSSLSGPGIYAEVFSPAKSQVTVECYSSYRKITYNH